MYVMVLSYLQKRGVSRYRGQGSCLGGATGDKPGVSFFHKNTCCGYSSEAPWWGTPNEYPQHKILSICHSVLDCLTHYQAVQTFGEMYVSEYLIYILQWCFSKQKKYCITKTSLFKYTENFTTKRMKIFKVKFWFFFLISALPRRGGSNEYPQSMFLSRNKENNVYPCKPQFYYIKVGFKGVKMI